jgi:sodium/bile acid cotransporter 7
VKQRLVKQWFLTALAAVLAIGLLLPEPLLPLANSSLLRNSIVATVLFLMALPLETRVVLRTVRRPWAAMLGSAVNMLLLPPLAWVASALVADEFATGVIVMSVAPCTLASAAVWTRRAGGNDAVAILVTLLTNSTCFLTMPVWLALLTGTQAEVDVREMITSLGVLVVAPMTVAQLCRLAPAIARRATRAKRFCSTLAQFGILAMVMIGAVQISTYLAATNWREAISMGALAAMGALVISLHLTILGAGYVLAQLAKFDRADQIAVAFAGSQKTLMVALYIAINYFHGLAILPIVVYHVGQLFVDTLIADRWAANRVNVSAEAEAELDVVD